MFGRATIALGIGPHSSSLKTLHCRMIASQMSVPDLDAVSLFLPIN